VEEAVEQVDIGGPTMIRAAAKNHRDVWVVVEPGDYGRVLDALDRTLDESPLRRELAAKVFRHMSRYDHAIGAYLEGAAEKGGESAGAGADGGVLGDALAVSLERLHTLRYGENPDQEAAFYAPVGGRRTGLAALRQRHGKELSYNNFLDLDGALLALSPFALSRRPAVCIVKHTTPCGLAVGDTLEHAYGRALATDPMSAFGSIIAVNRPVDGGTAARMSDLFIECIVAPSFTDEAMETLTEKKNLRLLEVPEAGVPDVELPVDAEGLDWWEEVDARVRGMTRFLAAHSRAPRPLVLRSVYGGALAQSPPVPPLYGIPAEDWKGVTEREPTGQEW